MANVATLFGGAGGRGNSLTGSSVPSKMSGTQTTKAAAMASKRNQIVASSSAAAAAAAVPPTVAHREDPRPLEDDEEAVRPAVAVTDGIVPAEATAPPSRRWPQLSKRALFTSPSPSSSTKETPPPPQQQQQQQQSARRLSLVWSGKVLDARRSQQFLEFITASTKTPTAVAADALTEFHLLQAQFPETFLVTDGDRERDGDGDGDGAVDGAVDGCRTIDGHLGEGVDGYAALTAADVESGGVVRVSVV